MERADAHLGGLYDSHASPTAIATARVRERDMRIAYEHRRRLEQAGLEANDPCTMADPGSDHNHPLEVEDAPSRPVRGHTLLPALPVETPIPDQVLPPVTPHRALQFDDQTQPTPA